MLVDAPIPPRAGLRRILPLALVPLVLLGLGAVITGCSDGNGASSSRWAGSRTRLWIHVTAASRWPRVTGSTRWTLDAG